MYLPLAVIDVCYYYIIVLKMDKQFKAEKQDLENFHTKYFPHKETTMVGI